MVLIDPLNRADAPAVRAKAEVSAPARVEIPLKGYVWAFGLSAAGWSFILALCGGGWLFLR